MGITLDFTVMIIVTFCLVLFSAVPSLQGAPGGGDPDLDLKSFYDGLHLCLQPMFSAYIGYYGYDAAEKLALEMIDYENSKGAAGRSEPLNDLQDIYPLLENINIHYKYQYQLKYYCLCFVLHARFVQFWLIQHLHTPTIHY